MANIKQWLVKVVAAIFILLMLAVALLLIFMIYDLVMKVYVGDMPASEYFSRWTQYINIPGLEALDETP